MRWESRGEMSLPVEQRIILDLCGGTGAWSKPYADAGYDVRIITLPPDIRLCCPPESAYGILAAPPCTHLAGSGARWWEEKGEVALLEALSIADACLRFVALCEPAFWALENPVGRLPRYYRKPVMYFDPCDYGDPYTKKTAVWGKFNKLKLNSVEPVSQKENPIWNMSPSDDRSDKRSITPSGFARAFFEANR